MTRQSPRQLARWYPRRAPIDASTTTANRRAACSSTSIQTCAQRGIRGAPRTAACCAMLTPLTGGTWILATRSTASPPSPHRLTCPAATPSGTQPNERHRSHLQTSAHEAQQMFTAGYVDPAAVSSANPACSRDTHRETRWTTRTQTHARRPCKRRRRESLQRHRLRQRLQRRWRGLRHRWHWMPLLQ